MPGKAAKVVITERQQSVLQELSVARTSEVRMAQRARIILLAFEGWKNKQIGAEVGMNPDQVGAWRKRWKAAFTKLVAVDRGIIDSISARHLRDILRRSWHTEI